VGVYIRCISSYDTKLYESKELHDTHGWYPLIYAKEYIDGAFGKLANYGCNVENIQETPDLPTEKYTGTAESCLPCTDCPDSWKEEYGPLEYFQDWIDCNNHKEGNDATVIISAREGAVNGGKARPWNGYAIAQTGLGLPDLPWGYTTHGYTQAFNCMSTILHEIGHLILGDVPDRDGDLYGHHDMSEINKRDSGDTMTPMKINSYQDDQAYNSYNNCLEAWNGESMEGYDMFYSECFGGDVDAPN